MRTYGEVYAQTPSGKDREGQMLVGGMPEVPERGAKEAYLYARNFGLSGGHYQSTPPKEEEMTPKFEITPRMASAAINKLFAYVEERRLAVEKGKVTDYSDAIRLMSEVDLFTTELASRAKTPAEKVYDTLRFTTVPNLMDGDGITTIGVEGVGKVHLQDDVQVKTEDKVRLMEWLTENELEDMITEQVNAQTLAAFVRRRIKEAGEKKQVPVLPDEKILTIKPIVRAVITRG